MKYLITKISLTFILSNTDSAIFLMRLHAPVLTARVPQFALGNHVGAPLHAFLGRATPAAHAGSPRTRLRLALETGAAPVRRDVWPRPGVPPVGGGGGFGLIEDRLVDWSLGFLFGGVFLGFFSFFYRGFIAKKCVML